MEISNINQFQPSHNSGQCNVSNVENEKEWLSWVYVGSWSRCSIAAIKLKFDCFNFVRVHNLLSGSPHSLLNFHIFTTETVKPGGSVVMRILRRIEFIFIKDFKPNYPETQLIMTRISVELLKLTTIHVFPNSEIL